MHPYGSDRVRVRDDGAIVLSCRVAKAGWNARVPKTLTRSEHPGTAILWDGDCYEVIDIETLPNGVGYILAPWSDEHTMRVSDTYDAKSEAKRAADRADVARRNKGRRAATLFGVLTGHLPGAVQEHLAHETGANAPLLTMISGIAEAIPFLYWLERYISARIAQQTPPMIPFGVLLLLYYMVADGAFRAGWSFLNGRPIGSIFGLIGYAIYYPFAPQRASHVKPFAPPRGEGTFRAEASAEEKLIDAVKVREPFFTLLSAPEQQRLAERWDYDHRRGASSIAWGILVTAILGVIASLQTLRFTPRLSAVVSLLVAGYLAVEQIVRLPQFDERPVGSILAFLVRPFARKFL